MIKMMNLVNTGYGYSIATQIYDLESDIIDINKMQIEMNIQASRILIERIQLKLDRLSNLCFEEDFNSFFKEFELIMKEQYALKKCLIYINDLMTDRNSRTEIIVDITEYNNRLGN